MIMETELHLLMFTKMRDFISLKTVITFDLIDIERK